LEKEVLKFYDEARQSSGKVAILEQRLYAKLEEISRDSPSVAEALSIVHQLLKAELHSHKPEAADQPLISLKDELRDLHEKAANSGEELERVQSCLEQTQKTLAATEQAYNSLRGDVMALNRRLEEQLKKTKSHEHALNSLRRELAETTHLLQDTREGLYPHKAQHYEDFMPDFIYSIGIYTDQMHRTDLVTGEQSSHRVPSYMFKLGCCLNEVPGGSLIVTGGKNQDDREVREVVSIDVGTFEVSPQPHMLTPRALHAAVYHSQHLYLIGGANGDRCLNECERYVCAELRWEALPPLPRACGGSSGVVVERSLFALGGVADGSLLDLVQKLSLESLTWELMQLRLPFAGLGIPCFKLRNTEVCLVVNRTLCSFTALEVRPLKTLTEDIRSSLWMLLNFMLKSKDISQSHQSFKTTELRTTDHS
jgi:hypothetical protein